MTKKFLGFRLLASATALIMLASCSDDGSSGSNNAEDSLSVVPSDNPFNSELPGESVGSDNNRGVVDVPEEPEENIADQPITEEDLKDDGTTSVSTLTVDVSGVAELGLFAE